MDTTLKTLLSAGLLGLTSMAHAAPVNVDVQVTADNAYAIYTGNEIDIYAFHATEDNYSAGEIAIAETYNFTMAEAPLAEAPMTDTVQARRAAQQQVLWAPKDSA